MTDYATAICILLCLAVLIVGTFNLTVLTCRIAWWGIEWLLALK